MTDFRQTIQNRLHQRFSQNATYVPTIGNPIEVNVKLRKGVAVYGEGMEFVGDEDQVVFLLTDIPEAKKRDAFIFTINEEPHEYHLIKSLQNDGVRAIWSVRLDDRYSWFR